MSSFSLSGGVEIIGFISPTDTNDTYPVIDPLYGIDGLRNVNLLSDLNSIPELRRRAGMVVGVSGGTTYYKLNPSPWTYTLSDWSVFSSGGGISGNYLPLSGGTVTGGTIFNSGLSANTISASTYLNLPIDLTITGISYSNNTLTITNNSGNTLSTQINSFTGLSINGILSATTISGGTLYGNGLNLTGIKDTFVTGGTYSNGSATFTNNTGGTFSVSGFVSGDTYVTGATFTGTTLVISQNENKPDISANISTVSLSGALSSVTFNIATSGSISGGTYLGLPTDVFVTGGTYVGNTITFRNNTGGTFTVTGITTSSTFTGGTVTGATNFTGGLTANTISATTYQNLPVTADTFTTAFTYNNNVFTINRNQNLASLTATINTVTGWTVNGNITVTGTSALNGTISSTGLAGSTDRIVQVSSGGTISASANIISAYITSGGTAATLLENASNWDINGNYTGTAITGTFQGQKHYDGNYFYEAVSDNNFIRLIRG